MNNSVRLTLWFLVLMYFIGQFQSGSESGRCDANRCLCSILGEAEGHCERSQRESPVELTQPPARIQDGMQLPRVPFYGAAEAGGQ